MNEHGVIVLESEDVYSSLLRLISKDYISYIGYYHKNNVKIYEALTGKAPSMFPQNTTMDYVLQLPQIKRISYYEANVDDYTFNEAIENVKDDNDIPLATIHEHILLYYSKINNTLPINTGYNIINNIISYIMNTDYITSTTSIIANNILNEEIKVVNEVIIPEIIDDSTMKKVNIFSSTIKQLYLKNENYRKYLNNIREINYNDRIKPISDLYDHLNKLRNEIRMICNGMYNSEIIHIDLSKLVDCYNDLIKHCQVGDKIPDDTIPTSHAAIISTRGCLNVNTETVSNSYVKIMKADEGTIKINSDFDGNIMIPLFNADLSDLCTQDLHNLHEMINSLNVTDPRFHDIQNKITDILADR